MAYYTAMKKNKLLHATPVNLTDILLSERSQASKSRALFIYRKLKKRQNESVVIEVRMMVTLGQY